MSENLHNIDKLFKNAIEDHEDLPSGDVWNNIDKGLDKNKVVSIQRKYYVLKRVAVAVFIFGFVATVFAIYFNSRYYNPQAGNGNTQTNDLTTIKVNHNASDKSVNNITNKTIVDKETQVTSVPDPNLSNHTKDLTNISSSFVSSNKSATALSSYNYNKINKAPSSSRSNTIVPVQSSKREFLLQDKNHLNTVKNGNNETSGVSNDKNKTANQSNKKESLNQSNDRIREKIVGNRLLYTFQPTFSKAFNQSHLAPETMAPISKLKKQARIAVTVFAGPQKNITHFKDDDDQQSMRRGNRDEFKHSEQSRNSVRTGVLFEYPLTSNWSIGSGIVYSSTNTSIDPKIVFAKPDGRGNIKYEFNCSAGYTYIPAKPGSTPLIGDSAKVFNSKTHISYVSIPVMAGYNLSAGKFILKPSAGLLLNFLSTGKIESVISSNSMNPMSSTNSISGLKSTYLSGEVNFTAIYQVNNKLGIMIAPGTQFALTSINKNTSVKTYPGYVGVTGGVRVAF